MKKMKVAGTIEMGTGKGSKSLRFKGTLFTNKELNSPVRKKAASKVSPI